MYDDPEERKAIKEFDETLREAQTLVDLNEAIARGSRTIAAILHALNALFVVATLGLGVALGVLISIVWG